MSEQPPPQKGVPPIELPGSPDQQQNPARNLPVGSWFQSPQYVGGRSHIVGEQTLQDHRKLIDSAVRREWEYVSVARPVDIHEKVYDVPTVRTVQTFLPKVRVREVVKTIPKEEIVWEEKHVELPHQKLIDKYVEVPVVSGSEVKYVPKVEVRERVIETSVPEVKWVEKVIEVPQVKEVVRYIESDKNVETVIRYVPKGLDSTAGEPGGPSAPAKRGLEAAQPTPVRDQRRDILTPRSTVPISVPPLSGRGLPSPRLDQIDQLFIPRVSRTVELEKQVPVTVDVPVPFMVPKPIQVPVDVPVIRFRDHFVPVPVRRHVIPKVAFTDDTFEVDCINENPVMVTEERKRPVPCDVKIRLKEKDIKIIPIDPAELSHSDFHAMWMRVNADLLARTVAAGGNAEVERALDKAENKEVEPATTEEEEAADPGMEGESEETRLARVQSRREQRKQDAERREEIRDPDFGPLPLHPGHPLMMTYLQNQWIQNPSTITHNMYSPEFFRYHASALDGLLHPQPHQVNITQNQSLMLGPLPAEAMPSPWNVWQE